MLKNDEILFIDKPKGITSFDVIRRLRRELGIRKMGHAGTLDPLATGLLIIGIGNATKELSKYMNLEKEYEVLIEFGKVSDTYDADGRIEQAQASEIPFYNKITRANFETALQQFIGKILQMPPAFSAKRIGGQRAYDLARQGKTVSLKPTEIEIKNIEILDWNWPEVRLRVVCGKGTYIRSLAHDLGQTLGCGGYVKELRRTRIGEWKITNCSNYQFPNSDQMTNF